MFISGIYVETNEGQAGFVAAQLIEFTGVEIQHIHEEKKVILTLEADTVDESYNTAEKFKELEGVLGICLVYTNFEDEPFYQVAIGNR